MQKEFPFDELPAKVAEMDRKLDAVLLALSAAPKEKNDFLMTMEDLRIYLPEQPARQTVYCWVFDRKIPFEKYGKRLYFRKSTIDIWLANGRRV